MTAAQPEGPTPGKLLGQRVKRKEDPRLLQGRATFVDDVQLPGMLHVAFKRSYVPHGRIARIDTSTAEAMPGVELVMTGAELKEILAPQPVLSPFPHPDHWSIAPEKVNYVGDPVAVVVASDRYLARDAADAIEVEIDELPAVVAPEQAMLGKPTVIHEAFDNNLAAPLVLSGTGVNLEDGSVDDSLIADAFAKAELLISQRMVNHRLAPSAMEARGIVAHFEPDKEQLTVWFSGQSAHWAKSYLTQYLDLSDHQVRVITPEVGGGFGAKIALYGEGYVTAALSKQLGRPLKWIEDRSEAFLATTHGRDLIGYVDLAAKRDGTLLGLKVRIIADIGAYQMLHTTISPSTTQGMLSGTYNIRRFERLSPWSLQTRRQRTRIAERVGPKASTSWSGRSTCSRASWTWIRRRCDERTSSSPISSPFTAKPGTSTTRETTSGYSTKHSRSLTGRASRRSATRPGAAAASSGSGWPSTSRSAGSDRPP